MPVRDTRHQAAVIHQACVLLVHVVLADGRSLWLRPLGLASPSDSDTLGLV